jgi:hypothetical protein
MDIAIATVQFQNISALVICMKISDRFGTDLKSYEDFFLKKIFLTSVAT